MKYVRINGKLYSLNENPRRRRRLGYDVLVHEKGSVTHVGEATSRKAALEIGLTGLAHMRVRDLPVKIRRYVERHCIEVQTAWG